MTLIEEIQQEAVDSKTDLGALLRKCKLLAARLGSKPLEDWLIWESNGYPDDVEVPGYRIWSLELKGHFCGPFGSAIHHAPIPWVCVPEELRDAFQTYRCRQSIASIQDLVQKAEGGTLQVHTGDLAVALGTNVYQNQNCIQAWAEFSVGNLIELLNAVRNRILDFAIAIWKEAPNAGEVQKADGGIETARVTQIFNTTVYGGAANIVGSADNSSVSFSVSENDLESLEKVLRDAGVSERDLEELRSALAADSPPERGAGFGSRVSDWIAGMMRKAAQGSWKVGLSVAGNLLAKAISRYYGL